MPRIKAKIHYINDGGNKIAIIEVSLGGKVPFSREELQALVEKAEIFKRVFVVLHGKDDKCEEWRKKYGNLISSS